MSKQKDLNYKKLENLAMRGRGDNPPKTWLTMILVASLILAVASALAVYKQGTTIRLILYVIIIGLSIVFIIFPIIQFLSKNVQHQYAKKSSLVIILTMFLLTIYFSYKNFRRLNNNTKFSNDMLDIFIFNFIGIVLLYISVVTLSTNGHPDNVYFQIIDKYNHFNWSGYIFLASIVFKVITKTLRMKLDRFTQVQEGDNDDHDHSEHGDEHSEHDHDHSEHGDEHSEHDHDDISEFKNMYQRDDDRDHFLSLTKI